MRSAFVNYRDVKYIENISLSSLPVGSLIKLRFDILTAMKVGMKDILDAYKERGLINDRLYGILTFLPHTITAKNKEYYRALQDIVNDEGLTPDEVARIGTLNILITSDYPSVETYVELFEETYDFLKMSIEDRLKKRTQLHPLDGGHA